jgi:hypothetical protein
MIENRVHRLVETTLETIYNIDFSEPILYTAIHAGHGIPDDIVKKIGISEIDRLREEDPYTQRFICDKNNHIIQLSSRFYYDINRARENAIYQRPEQCWGLPIYPTAKLTTAEIELAYQKYNRFYENLEIIVESFLKIHQKLFVWDVHSYNHRRNGDGEAFDSDEENPEIILGTNNSKYMSPKWIPFVNEIQKTMSSAKFFGDFKNRSLLQKNLDVRVDVKFPGGYLSQWLNSRYGDRVCCIAIEFKKIWMNEWTGVVDEECFFRLKKIFEQIDVIL